MKTNQIMQLSFDDYQLEIGHKDMMGSLTKLWTIGNARRIKKGLPELSLPNYLRSPETEELVRACELEFGIISDVIESNKEFNSVESTELKKSKGRVETIKSPLIKVKEGRYGGTWIHLCILLDTAGKLDANFKVQIYKIVVEGGLLQWRDNSGDSYKKLNIAIDLLAQQQCGEYPSKWVYINVANAIRFKIKPTGGNWNTATHYELEIRNKLEEVLVAFIKAGLVRNYAHLIKLIEDYTL